MPVSWTKRSLGGAAPQAISSLMTITGSLSSSMGSIFDTTAGALDTAKGFIAGKVDPALIGVQTLCDEILTEINDLKNTGFHTMVIHPYTEGSGASYDRVTGLMSLPPSVLLNVLRTSFDDRGDVGRPDFSSSAICGGFIDVVAAPDPATFAPLLAAIGNFFNLLTLQNAAKLIAENGVGASGALGGRSILPDWEFCGVTDLFPAFGDALDVAEESMLAIKDSGTSAAKSIENLVVFLEALKANLLKINQKLQASVDKFTQGIAGTGNYTLWVPPNQGGIDELKTSIVLGENCPPDTLGFCACVAMVAGSASMEVLGEFLDLG